MPLNQEICFNTYVTGISIIIFLPILILFRVFASRPGNRGSIPGRAIPKTKKMVLDVSLHNTKHYKIWIYVKWCNPWKGMAPFPTLLCSSYWKGSHRTRTAKSTMIISSRSTCIFPLFYYRSLIKNSYPAIHRTYEPR